MVKKHVAKAKRPRKAPKVHSATARDITEPKRMEEILQSSEKSYMDLAESISDVFFAMDSDLRYTYWNKASENLTGISAKDAIGKSIFEVFPDTEDTRRAVTIYREVLKTRQHKEFINEYRLGDRNFIFEISVYRDYSAVRIYALDITERRRAEEALRLSESKYRSLIDNATDLIFLIGEKDKVLSVNRAAAGIFGKTPEQVVGKSLFDIYPKEIATMFSENVKAVLETGKRKTIDEKIAFRKDELWINTRLEPLLDERGRAYGVTGIARDITERKQMEERLQEAEHRFRNMFQSSPDGVLIADVATQRFMYSNPAVQQLLGYSGEELLKMGVEDIHPRASLEHVISEFKDQARRAKTLAMNIPCLRKDGAIVYVDINTSNVSIHGRSHNIGFFRDVSERRRMEEELRRYSEHLERLVDERTRSLHESEERYRIVADFTYDWEAWERPDGSLNYVSPSCERITGYTAAEFVNKPILLDDLILPEDKEAWTVHHHESITQLKQGSIEFRIRRRDGGVTWIEHVCNAVYDDNHKYIGVRSSNRDITQRKKIEQELRESEYRFRSLFDHLGDGVLVMDIETKKLFLANKAMCQMLGYRLEEIKNMRVMDIIPKESVPFALKQFDKQSRDEIEGNTDIPIERSDGSIFYVDITSSSLIFDGRTYLMGVFRDITERRRMGRMRDEFISAISHELRTPLGPLKIHVEHVLAGKLGPVPEKIRSSLQVIKLETDRLVELIDAVLDVQRFQSDRFELNLQPLDIRKVVGQGVEETKVTVEMKQQHLHVEVPDKLLPISGDAVRLGEVLTNLLSNASKFTPENGQITINVRDEAEALKVSVSDTGIGIRKEDLPMIFQPFATIKKHTWMKGAGLGLSVTKGIIEAHGGKIWAESDGEGKGATFTFTIPRPKGES